jgi:hypothetical protein
MMRALVSQCTGFDAGGGDVVGLAARPHPAMDPLQPMLGAPGDLQHVVGLAGLAVAQRGADRRLASIVPGRLDQQPAGGTRAALGDLALA